MTGVVGSRKGSRQSQHSSASSGKSIKQSKISFKASAKKETLEIDLTEEEPSAKPLTLGFVDSSVETQKQEDNAANSKQVEFEISEKSKTAEAPPSKIGSFHLTGHSPVSKLSDHNRNQIFDRSQKPESGKDYSTASQRIRVDATSLRSLASSIARDGHLYNMDRLTKMAQQIAIKSNLENIQKSALKELGAFLIDMMTTMISDLI